LWRSTTSRQSPCCHQHIKLDRSAVRRFCNAIADDGCVRDDQCGTVGADNR
jgi:hypothetical protein